MSKYRAVPTTIDNIRFASKKEAARYSELKLWFRAGQIRNLEIQPEFECLVDGIKIGTYRADFAYFKGGVRIIEDVKSPPTKTPLYRWKKKHVEAEYKVKIVEV